MSRSRNYIAGLVTGYSTTFFTVVIGLWLTPFTLRFLDREQYAIFALANDVLMWLTLMDLGTTSGLRTHAAQLTGRPDQERMNALASSAFYAQLVVVACMILVGCTIAYVFPNFFSVRADLQSDAQSVIMLLLIGSALSIGVQPFSALLIAHQQVHIDNALNLLNLFLRTMITVGLLYAGMGLYSLAYATIAAKVISATLAVIRVRRLLPALRISLRFATWDSLRQLWRIGLWLSLGGIGMLALNSLDTIITAKIISVEMVTTMTLTNRVYTLAFGLLSQITETARPMLGQLFGAGKKEETLRVYRQLVVVSTGSAAIVSASLWAGNAAFVRAWVGQANYGGVWLDAALAATLFVQCWIMPHRAALTANFIVKPHTLIRFVESLLGVALSVTLGRQFGLAGVAWGVVIAAVATSVWYLPFLTARMFERPVLKFLREDSSQSGILVLMLVPCGLLVRWLCGPVHGLAGAFLTGGIVMATGALLLWFVTLDVATKARVQLEWGKIRSRFPLAAAPAERE